MKSMNRGSVQPLSTRFSSFDPGGPRIFPRRERLPQSMVEPSGNVVAVQYLG